MDVLHFVPLGEAPKHAGSCLPGKKNEKTNKKCQYNSIIVHNVIIDKTKGGDKGTYNEGYNVFSSGHVSINLSRSLKLNDGKVPEATKTLLFAALPIAVMKQSKGGVRREGMGC